MTIEQINRKQVFEFLRPDQIDSLSNKAEVIKAKAGQSVYQRGDKADFLYVVLSGEVALRLPGKDGVSILIDQLTETGSMFGACTSPSIDTCVLTAQCEQDTELLKIEKSALKQLLDDDPRMGYAIQSRIAEIYFKRYVEAMRKLEAIVMNLPIQSDRRSVFKIYISTPKAVEGKGSNPRALFQACVELAMRTAAGTIS